jgi:methyl-galactoside transport system substrate-binding protein
MEEHNEKIIPQVKKLIEKGEMLGSVYQDERPYVDALYICGMNLAVGKSHIEGTNYKLEDTQVAIRLPQSEYLYNNTFS